MDKFVYLPNKKALAHLEDESFNCHIVVPPPFASTVGSLNGFNKTV